MLTALQDLGLSFYEAKALGVILRESVTAKELSRHAEIPLGKVYSVLLSLQAKGLVHVQKVRPEQYYVHQPGQVVSTLIRHKEEEHERTITTLRDWATTLDQSLTAPRLFQIGLLPEEQQALQLRVFAEATHEVCQIMNLHHKPSSNRLAKTQLEKEITTAVERGVNFRSIYPKGVKLPGLLASLSPESFSVRRFDTDTIRCDVVDKRKVLLKLLHPDAGYCAVLFIESTKLAKQLQDSFEQLWDRAGNQI